MDTNSGQERRQHLRVIAKSIIVSLTAKHGDQQITGFLKDISEGGMKIQKISAKRQVEKGEYHCEFVLPDSGKIEASVEVLGFGSDAEKFGEHLIRMRFIDLEPATKDKIGKFITNNRPAETDRTD